MLPLQIHSFFLQTFQRMQTQYGNGVSYGVQYDANNRQVLSTSEPLVHRLRPVMTTILTEILPAGLTPDPQVFCGVCRCCSCPGQCPASQWKYLHTTDTGIEPYLRSKFPQRTPLTS